MRELRRICWVAVVTGLVLSGSARPARAQGLLAPWFRVAEYFDEKKLAHDEARLQADIQSGNSARVTRDLQQLQRDQWWLEVDRRGRAFGPAPPLPNPLAATAGLGVPLPYPGYGAAAATPLPGGGPSPLPVAAPALGAPPTSLTVPAPAPGVLPWALPSVTIVNPRQTGTAVNYVVDGATYRTESGELQNLATGPSSTILYDRGGTFGVQRYALSAGVYEFRPSETGWALVKLRKTP